MGAAINYVPTTRRGDLNESSDDEEEDVEMEGEDLYELAEGLYDDRDEMLDGVDAEEALDALEVEEAGANEGEAEVVHLPSSSVHVVATTQKEAEGYKLFLSRETSGTGYSNS